MNNLIKTTILLLALGFLMSLTSCFGLIIPNKKKMVKAHDKASEIIFVMAETDVKNKYNKRDATAFNEYLKVALSKYWANDLKYKVMSRDDAYDYRKKDKTALIAEFRTRVQTQGVGMETTLDIMAKLRKIISVRLPNGIGEVDIAYAVNTSQFMLDNIATFNKPSKELPKKYGYILKKKTLLIAKEQLDGKLTESKIKKIYPHKFKIVTQQEVDEAIMAQDKSNVVLYQANSAGITVSANYAYWNVYQPSDGVVISRHSGTGGFNEKDLALIVKRTK